MSPPIPSARLPLRAYWNLLADHVRPQWPMFALLVALMLGNTALQVLNPQIVRTFIDSALGGGEISRLAWVGAAFLGVTLLMQAVQVGLAYTGESVAWNATNALREELAAHCLRLDMNFHGEHNPGELIERVDGDVSELALFFSQLVLTVAGNLLLIAGILLALAWEDWRFGLAFALYAAIALWSLNQVRDLPTPAQKQRRQAVADMSGLVEEQLSAAEDIRSSGAVGYSLGRLLQSQRAIYRADQLSAWLRLWLSGVMRLANLAGTGLAVLGGWWLWDQGLITLGAAFLFVQYAQLLETPLRDLAREMESFQTIGACVERLTELRARRSAIQDGSDAGLSLAGGPLGVRFQQVSFAYPNSLDAVLSDISFELAPGRVLGVLGRTGSGKTTLARLLLRLYDPLQGQIVFRGRQPGSQVSTRQLAVSALRQRVAIVTQDVQLFRASLRDNLTFFDPAISDAQIEAALGELGLEEWVRNLPQGLDTLLAAGGRSLSAGEAQLLAFTRVFLRQPGLVILDEASSRLDPATEQHIEQAINRLLRDRTAIIIAHRLDTVQRTDEILILEDGHKLEYGPRAALAADPQSHFAGLLRTGLSEALA